MVDHLTKLAQEKRRMELATHQRDLRLLAEQMRDTTDGAFYRAALAAIPDADWRAFWFELVHLLSGPSITSPVAHLAQKRKLLAQAHRERAIEAGRERVERVARMDVPGVNA